MIVFLSLLITYAFFGLIGYSLSRRFKANPAPYKWIALGLAAVLSQWCFVSFRLIDVFSIAISMNYALQAIFAGVLIGLVRRELWPKSK